MKKLFTLMMLAGLGLILSAGSLLAQENCSACKDNKAPEGFTALFNGKDLNGWVGMKGGNPYKFEALSAAEKESQLAAWDKTFKEHWTVENGELVNDGQGAYATTAKKYKNFELLIDYKTVPIADSGIYLRGTPQVQIWDYTKEGGKWKLGADKGSGGLWNNKKNPKDPLVFADKPFGQWNHFRITLKGEIVNVWLNGKHIVKDTVLENYWNRDLPLIEEGPIMLQTHGGEIRWKNIFIKELEN
ncbi:MAG: DUF1080 domain-containing protein [Planctomycetia bacterium]|nr:DUF1080 domain-containing protein [Planctomycetia bacterium]